ncbi:unnamed protein product [Amoebophrya sp. A120]|nr:unnamed protein product [Amoebophrya sp. A120]|eukprot:GSA120T00015941001.1
MKGGSRRRRKGLLFRCEGSGDHPGGGIRSRRAINPAFIIQSLAVVLFVREAATGVYGRVAARRSSSTTTQVERSEPSTGPPTTRPPFFPTPGTNNRFHGGLCLNRYPPCNRRQLLEGDTRFCDPYRIRRCGTSGSDDANAYPAAEELENDDVATEEAGGQQNGEQTSLLQQARSFADGGAGGDHTYSNKRSRKTRSSGFLFDGFRRSRRSSNAQQAPSGFFSTTSGTSASESILIPASYNKSGGSSSSENEFSSGDGDQNNYGTTASHTNTNSVCSIERLEPFTDFYENDREYVVQFTGPELGLPHLGELNGPCIETGRKLGKTTSTPSGTTTEDLSDAKQEDAAASSRRSCPEICYEVTMRAGECWGLEEVPVNSVQVAKKFFPPPRQEHDDNGSITTPAPTEADAGAEIDTDDSANNSTTTSSVSSSSANTTRAPGGRGDQLEGVVLLQQEESRRAMMTTKFLAPEDVDVQDFAIDTILSDNSCMGRCGQGCIASDTKSVQCSNWGRDCLRYDVCSFMYDSIVYRYFNKPEEDLACSDEYFHTLDDVSSGCNPYDSNDFDLFAFDYCGLRPERAKNVCWQKSAAVCSACELEERMDFSYSSQDGAASAEDEELFEKLQPALVNAKLEENAVRKRQQFFDRSSFKPQNTDVLGSSTGGSASGDTDSTNATAEKITNSSKTSVDSTYSSAVSPVGEFVCNEIPPQPTDAAVSDPKAGAKLAAKRTKTTIPASAGVGDKASEIHTASMKGASDSTASQVASRVRPSVPNINPNKEPQALLSFTEALRNLREETTRTKMLGREKEDAGGSDTSAQGEEKSTTAKEYPVQLPLMPVNSDQVTAQALLLNFTTPTTSTSATPAGSDQDNITPTNYLTPEQERLENQRKAAIDRIAITLERKLNQCTKNDGKNRLTGALSLKIQNLADAPNDRRIFCEKISLAVQFALDAFVQREPMQRSATNRQPRAIVDFCSYDVHRADEITGDLMIDFTQNENQINSTHVNHRSIMEKNFDRAIKQEEMQKFLSQHYQEQQEKGNGDNENGSASKKPPSKKLGLQLEPAKPVLKTSFGFPETNQQDPAAGAPAALMQMFDARQQEFRGSTSRGSTKSSSTLNNPGGPRIRIGQAVCGVEMSKNDNGDKEPVVASETLEKTNSGDGDGSAGAPNDASVSAGASGDTSDVGATGTAAGQPPPAEYLQFLQMQMQTQFGSEIGLGRSSSSSSTASKSDFDFTDGLLSPVSTSKADLDELPGPFSEEAYSSSDGDSIRADLPPSIAGVQGLPARLTSVGTDWYPSQVFPSTLTAPGSGTFSGSNALTGLIPTPDSMYPNPLFGYSRKIDGSATANSAPATQLTAQAIESAFARVGLGNDGFGRDLDVDICYRITGFDEEEDHDVDSLEGGDVEENSRDLPPAPGSSKAESSSTQQLALFTQAIQLEQFNTCVNEHLRNSVLSAVKATAIPDHRVINVHVYRHRHQMIVAGERNIGSKMMELYQPFYTKMEDYLKKHGFMGRNESSSSSSTAAVSNATRSASGSDSETTAISGEQDAGDEISDVSASSTDDPITTALLAARKTDRQRSTAEPTTGNKPPTEIVLHVSRLRSILTVILRAAVQRIQPGQNIGDKISTSTALDLNEQFRGFEFLVPKILTMVSDDPGGPPITFKDSKQATILTMDYDENNLQVLLDTETGTKLEPHNAQYQFWNTLLPGIMLDNPDLAGQLEQMSSMGDGDSGSGSDPDAKGFATNKKSEKELQKSQAWASFRDAVNDIVKSARKAAAERREKAEKAAIAASKNDETSGNIKTDQQSPTDAQGGAAQQNKTETLRFQVATLEKRRKELLSLLQADREEAIKLERKKRTTRKSSRTLANTKLLQLQKSKQDPPAAAGEEPAEAGTEPAENKASPDEASEADSDPDSSPSISPQQQINVTVTANNLTSKLPSFANVETLLNITGASTGEYYCEKPFVFGSTAPSLFTNIRALMHECLLDESGCSGVFVNPEKTLGYKCGNGLDEVVSPGIKKCAMYELEYGAQQPDCKQKWFLVRKTTEEGTESLATPREIKDPSEMLDAELQMNTTTTTTTTTTTSTLSYQEKLELAYQELLNRGPAEKEVEKEGEEIVEKEHLATPKQQDKFIAKVESWKGQLIDDLFADLEAVQNEYFCEDDSGDSGGLAIRQSQDVIGTLQKCFLRGRGGGSASSKTETTTGSSTEDGGITEEAAPATLLSKKHQTRELALSDADAPKLINPWDTTQNKFCRGVFINRDKSLAYECKRKKRCDQVDPQPEFCAFNWYYIKNFDPKRPALKPFSLARNPKDMAQKFSFYMGENKTEVLTFQVETGL